MNNGYTKTSYWMHVRQCIHSVILAALVFACFMGIMAIVDKKLATHQTKMQESYRQLSEKVDNIEKFLDFVEQNSVDQGPNN